MTSFQSANDNLYLNQTYLHEETLEYIATLVFMCKLRIQRQLAFAFTCRHRVPPQMADEPTCHLPHVLFHWVYDTNIWTSSTHQTRTQPISMLWRGHRSTAKRGRLLKPLRYLSATGAGILWHPHIILLIEVVHEDNVCGLAHLIRLPSVWGNRVLHFVFWVCSWSIGSWNKKRAMSYPRSFCRRVLKHYWFSPKRSWFKAIKTKTEEFIFFSQLLRRRTSYDQLSKITVHWRLWSQYFQAPPLIAFKMRL